MSAVDEGAAPPAPAGASAPRVIAALAVTYMLYAVLLNSVGTVILQAVRAFGVGKAEAGVLEGCKDLSIAAASFLLASFLPRLGYRRALVAGLLALACACALMPLLDSFWMTAASFAVTGATFGLAKVAVYGSVGLVADDPRRHASLTSLIEGLFMAGVVGGYWLFSAFIPPEGGAGAGWLDVYWVLAAASLAAAGLWLATPLDERRLRPAGGSTGAAPFAAMLALLGRPVVGVFLLCAFLYVLIEQSLGTWMPTFNHEVLKLSPALAVQLSSVYAGSLCFGRLGGSAVLRRFGRFPVLGVCTAATAVLLLAALAATRGLDAAGADGWRAVPPAAFLLPGMGLFLSVIYPTLVSVVLSALPVERHAAMTGLVVVFSALGGTLGSFITGRVFGVFGGRQAVAAVLVPLALLFAALMLLARLTPRPQAPGASDAPSP